MLKIDEQKTGAVKWGIWGLYTVLVILGVINHESWADEAQSWLIARDNNLAGIFTLLPSEGHPPLWYLILYPISHAGLPYESIKWLTAIICIATVYIILFRTRIPVLLKLIVPFSYLFLFEYAHFGRSYCLIVFFVATVISLYPQRFEKPWLFALCIIGLYNTHILAFSLAFGLTVLYIIDIISYKKAGAQTWGALAIMCLGGLYLIPYLTGDKMVSHFASTITGHNEKIMSAINGAILIEGSPVISLLLLVVILLLLIQRTKVSILSIIAMAGVIYILGYKYSGTLRHFGVIFIILFACYGIADQYKDDALNTLKNLQQPFIQYGTWVLCAVVLLQLSYTYKSYQQDIDGLYSDSKNVAEYIQDNVPKDAIIVGWQATTTLGVLPYLPDRKLYYAECQRFGTHYIYDSCFRESIWMNPVDYAVKISHDNFKDSLDRLVFLFNYPIMPQSERFLDLVYKTSDITARWDESFYIYKFKENVK